MNLWASAALVNATTGDSYGEDHPYETFTDNPGKLFRALRREYGRCTGSVHIDTKEGKTRRIGWVFVKRAEYADHFYRGHKPDTYLQETWISLHNGPPEIRAPIYQYHDL